MNLPVPMSEPEARGPEEHDGSDFIPEGRHGRWRAIPVACCDGGS